MGSILANLLLKRLLELVYIFVNTSRMQTYQSPDAMELIYPFAIAAGDFGYRFGLKKIHGQVWAYLYLSMHPLDASALMQSLKVSKAQMSITLRALVELGAVTIAGRTTYGRTLYRANAQLDKLFFEIFSARGREHLPGLEQKLRPIAKISSIVDGVSEQRTEILLSQIQRLTELTKT
jgi:DNA-binding transcriptional regulator GbsR (MarR family)